ncbi:MarR family winged helix-turn-helix transcriptional regulator [Erysipelothrix urinaevulpis]|uniref:MarR family winged helix-turn-helix transcriptional regulator n=1 Tax=Erysipelothrix urinaevulpis TaxID=2683717 RepID=UPI0019153B9C|nr:MarR family transcriptional regulator [Erysipelothrix urinaevulpis]
MDETLSLKLFVVMSKAMKSVEQAVEKEIKKLGISPSEFGILEVLYHKGELPVQEIAEKILISSSRIAYTLKQLETKNLIKRRKCNVDGRVFHISLSMNGLNLMDDVFIKHKQDLVRIFSVLNDDEKKTMIESLKKLGLSI